MTAWRLRFREPTTLPVDASALRPELCAGKTAGELERLPLQLGNRLVALGDLAEVTAGDADTLELARMEVRELVAGSFLDGAPIVPVSARTGGGLDAFRAALVDASTSRRSSRNTFCFRS